MRYRAAFLDRDGTIIEDRHYLARPEDVVLLPGAASAIARLNAAAVRVVVVTNQSGIARGYVQEDDYRHVTARLAQLLDAGGARVDASYHCPHYPPITGPCACRKPGLALYERAIAELALDARRSLFAGDRLHDVEPATAFGGLGVLVIGSDTPPEERDAATRRFTAVATLDAAVDAFIGAPPTAGCQPRDTSARPEGPAR